MPKYNLNKKNSCLLIQLPLQQSHWGDLRPLEGHFRNVLDIVPVIVGCCQVSNYRKKIQKIKKYSDPEMQKKSKKKFTYLFNFF